MPFGAQSVWSQLNLEPDPYHCSIIVRPKSLWEPNHSWTPILPCLILILKRGLTLREPILLEPNPCWRSKLMEVRYLWDPTPQENPICKGARSLKKPNPCLISILKRGLPLRKPILLEPNPYWSSIFVEVWSLWEPTPQESPICRAPILVGAQCWWKSGLCRSQLLKRA